MTYEFTQAARRDLAAIDSWVLENFGPAFADRTQDRLFDAFSTIVKFPKIGLQKPELSVRSRFLLETPYWIMYKPGKRLVIQRVYHSARDLKRMHHSF